jgi:hypothetical protein
MKTDIEAITVEEFLIDLRNKLKSNVLLMEKYELEDTLEDLYELQLAYDSDIGMRLLIKQCIRIIQSEINGTY